MFSMNCLMQPTFSELSLSSTRKARDIVHNNNSHKITRIKYLKIHIQASTINLLAHTMLNSFQTNFVSCWTCFSCLKLRSQIGLCSLLMWFGMYQWCSISLFRLERTINGPWAFWLQSFFYWEKHICLFWTDNLIFLDPMWEKLANEFILSLNFPWSWLWKIISTWGLACPRLPHARFGDLNIHLKQKTFFLLLRSHHYSRFSYFVLTFLRIVWFFLSTIEPMCST